MKVIQMKKMNVSAAQKNQNSKKKIEQQVEKEL